MRMGHDGVALVKPDQNGGLEVTDPTPEAPEPEAPEPEAPEVPEEEYPDVVPQSQGMQSTSVEPPQVDYEIYDEVTEIKIKN